MSTLLRQKLFNNNVYVPSTIPRSQRLFLLQPLASVASGSSSAVVKVSQNVFLVNLMTSTGCVLYTTYTISLIILINVNKPEFTSNNFYDCVMF